MTLAKFVFAALMLSTSLVHAAEPTWMAKLIRSRNWNEANEYCAEQGRGWRLPTVKEMKAKLDHTPCVLGSYRWQGKTLCSDYTAENAMLWTSDIYTWKEASPDPDSYKAGDPAGHGAIRIITGASESQDDATQNWVWCVKSSR